MMSFFRSYIAPLLIVLTFLLAMAAVSARIFLPNDMMAPAPVDEPVGAHVSHHSVASIKGLVPHNAPGISRVFTELA
jgi:hypothetical protein